MMNGERQRQKRKTKRLISHRAPRGHREIYECVKAKDKD